MLRWNQCCFIIHPHMQPTRYISFKMIRPQYIYIYVYHGLIIQYKRYLHCVICFSQCAVLFNIWCVFGRKCNYRSVYFTLNQYRTGLLLDILMCFEIDCWIIQFVNHRPFDGVFIKYHFLKLLIWKNNWDFLCITVIMPIQITYIAGESAPVRRVTRIRDVRLQWQFAVKWDRAYMAWLL